MWMLAATGLMAMGLVGGCAVPSQQILTAQTLSNRQAPAPNQDLQNQLMVQAPQASLTSYKDYKVGPEDQLVITILGQNNLNRELRVNGQGEISMPLVGAVKVGGLSPQEIEKRLVELYGFQYLRNPQVSVEVKEFRHRRVAITGAVVKPGYYEIIGPRTLLEMLAMAGGFSNRPDSGLAGDVVNVLRHQSTSDVVKAKKANTPQTAASQAETTVIDLRRLVSGQAPELNIVIQNGDVIHVPFAGTAYVLGAVKKPGNIPVKENLTLSQAVALAGGIDPLLGTSKITLLRFDDQGRPISIDTDLNSIVARNDPDIPIKSNDVVVVSESAVKKALFLFRQLLPQPTFPAF